MNDERECGSCGRQGDKVTSKEIQCRVDGKVYKRPHTCDDFIENIGGTTLDAKTLDALAVRKARNDKAAEDRMRNFKTQLQKDNKKFQIKLVWLAGLIAFITSLITTLIILWLK